MSNKEKEIKKPAEELSEDSLDNVSGGFIAAGKGDVWVVSGVTADNELYVGTATSQQEANDLIKRKQLKTGLPNGLSGISLECSPSCDGFEIINV